MKLFSMAVLATTALCVGCAKSPSSAVVEAQGQLWAKTLSEREPKAIANLYDEEAVLLATFSDKLDSPEEILAYFEGLTKNEGLRVRFDEVETKSFGPKSAASSGLYTFAYEKDGKTVEVPARFTFVYQKEKDGWKIVEHHSSTRPEKK